MSRAALSFALRISMALELSYDELLRYTNDEREKWRRWLQSHPEAMEVALQPGGRLPTVGKLIDHIFLVERRHLQQLTGDRMSKSTGLTGNNAPPLFDYGASVRRELEQFARVVEDEDDDAARQTVDAGADAGAVAAKDAVPYPYSRDPSLGADCAGGPPRRLHPAWRSRPRPQPRLAIAPSVVVSALGGRRGPAEAAHNSEASISGCFCGSSAPGRPWRRRYRCMSAPRGQR